MIFKRIYWKKWINGLL